MPEEKMAFGQAKVTVDESEVIDPRSRSIAEKRAIGLTHEKIAALHHVSSKTVQRTLEIPRIRELVTTLQSDMYTESTAQLLGLLGEAVNTMERLMSSDSDAVAARAASKVIDMAGPLVAHRAMEEQFTKIVEAIETRLEEM